MNCQTAAQMFTLHFLAQGFVKNAINNLEDLYNVVQICLLEWFPHCYDSNDFSLVKIGN